MSNFVTVSAERLRLSLSIVLGLLATLTIVLSILGLSALRNFASEVNGVVTEADAIDRRIEVTKQKISLYKRKSEAADLASRVVAQSEGYQYQNEAYNDLLAIANRAGLKITRYSFTDTPGIADDGANAPAPQTASGPTTNSTGAKPTYITVDLENPVDYRKFLNFLHYIEQNLTKMQISSVSLSTVDNSSDRVSTSAITVEVYIR